MITLRLLSFLVLISFLLMSCKKEFSTYAGTGQNYIALDIGDNTYSLKGEILYMVADKGYLSGNFSRVCPGGKNYYEGGENVEIRLYLSIPAYSDLVCEDIVEKKYYYEGGGCGYSFNGNKLFGFELSLTYNNRTYRTPYNDSSCYLFVEEINKLGDYYNYENKTVYEMKGYIETKLDNGYSKINIENCRYSVCFVTYKSR